MKNEYTIGTPDEDGSYKMWFGPCELTNCASQQGKSKDIIFHRIDDRMVPHSKWNGSKWIAIDFAEIKDSLIENIIIMLKVFNYQLKSKSHDDLILFFTHKDWRYGISIGVRIVGMDFVGNEKHDVRMAFTFSHDIINISTKKFK